MPCPLPDVKNPVTAATNTPWTAHHSCTTEAVFHAALLPPALKVLKLPALTALTRNVSQVDQIIIFLLKAVQVCFPNGTGSCASS